ncbi:hypothetical protein COJ50_14100 [Bacillus cereus]|uniref:Uncharacterized protein n=1 Tax=Bacillus cereus TaxID=1396 RepID=A0A2B1KFG4_BACCE|nr:hypothetical protein COJ50_14100 [Bacillus cereus]
MWVLFLLVSTTVGAAVVTKRRVRKRMGSSNFFVQGNYVIKLVTSGKTGVKDVISTNKYIYDTPYEKGFKCLFSHEGFFVLTSCIRLYTKGDLK